MLQVLNPKRKQYNNMNRCYKGLIVTFAFFTPFVNAHAQGVFDKEKALQKYKDEYLASSVKEATELKWKGNEKKCDEGSISSDVAKKALMRINYFRTLCGLHPVKFTDEFNKEAQKAAFIIYVNKRVSHDPDNSWKCYSEEARLAAGHCNLSATDFTYHPATSFVTGFIQDYGQSNDDVGHRRSILFSRAEAIGYGATPQTEAVRSPTNKLNEGDSLLLPKYFSYPPAGYNEIDLLFPRWSFSIPDVYKVAFKGSIVEMKDETGKAINLKVLPRYNFYDPTLVWEITDRLKRDYYLNHSFTVNIKNVQVNGAVRDYSYNVLFFDHVPAERDK